MKSLIGLTFAMLILFQISSTKGMMQRDTINFKNNKLRTKQLKPGLRQYLVYFQNPVQNKKLNLSLWTREVQLTEKNGKKCFSILQKWYGNDTASYRSVYSLNSVEDFAPVYHSETIGKNTKAFNWYADHISGADSIPDDKQKSFTLQLDQPCFNWNLDIETFEMLPLAAGKKFVIRFYDAGLAAPKNVNYEVSGEEVLTTMDRRKIDCWKLFSDGANGQMHYTQTFWISKEGHEFLMEEDTFNGMFRYKVKMPGYAPNMRPRFK